MALKMNIVLGAVAMEITPLPTVSNATELLTKANIVGVLPVKRQVKPATGYMKHGVPVGAFTLGETITGGTSGATATIYRFDGTGQFYLTNIVGTFVAAETVTGGTSAATATVSQAVQKVSTDEEWSYRYAQITVICITMNDGSEVQFELQDVANQGTWNTGTLAAQNAAVAAINAWL